MFYVIYLLLRQQLKHIFFILFVTFFLFGISNIYSQPKSSENNVKAVFIYNFTKYLEWSKEVDSKTFDIVIFGKSDITNPLIEIAKIRKAGEKKINVSQINDISKIPDCHILFVDPSEEELLPELLQIAKQKNILIISSKKGFGNQGVPINFVTIDGKVKFEINIDSIENIGVKPSSQLLKLAILIKDGKHINNGS